MRDYSHTYHCLPLNSQPLMRVWIHKIGRSNLSLKSNTRVCSDHIVNSRGCKLRADEYPTLRLPKLLTSRTSPKMRKAPTTRSTNKGEQSFHVSECNVDGSILAILNTLEAGVQVGSSCNQLVDASTCVHFPEKPLQLYKMCVESLKDDPDMFHYYTGFRITRCSWHFSSS